MQDIVDQMGSPEAKGFLPGWTLPEGEKGCQIKISNKAEDVAYAVGYNNLSHFSNTFKEYFGLSPKEYMQNAHEENATENDIIEE